MPKYKPATLDFQGHPIRVIDPDDGRGKFVPINDLAEAVGRDREAIRKTIQRDPVLRAHSVTYVTEATDGKCYKAICLDRPGVLILITKLNANRSSSAKTRILLITFQEWVGTVLEAAMMGRALPAPAAHRPHLSGALLTRMRAQLGHDGTTEAMVRIWPEWFANLPGKRPVGPQEVVTPTLGLTAPLHLELRAVER